VRGAESGVTGRCEATHPSLPIYQCAPRGANLLQTKFFWQSGSCLRTWRVLGSSGPGTQACKICGFSRGFFVYARTPCLPIYEIDKATENCARA
jgi:hypothetical protein